MAYGDFKDLIRKTVSDKILRGKAFNIAKNPKNYGYQCRFTSMVYRFFDKMSAGDAATLARSNTLAIRNKSAVKNENMTKKESL